MGWSGRRRVGLGVAASVAALLAGPLAAPAPAQPPAAPTAQPAAPPAPSATNAAGPTNAAAESTTPLRVELDVIDPGHLPREGVLRVTGTVTNDDEDPWDQVNLYTILDDDPIDDSAELEAATLVAEEVPVGDRITREGTEARVPGLDPGESAEFSLAVPSEVLVERVGGADAEPGVYWFGVHALGSGPDGRDDVADARARTFLPLLPRQVADPVRTSIVIPLRRPVDRLPDGSLTDVEAWSVKLGPGGRLRRRLSFGAASGAAPVSWLLDPAVLDAAAQLAAGNEPFRLTTPEETGGAPPGSSSPDPSTTPAPSEGGSATAEADAPGPGDAEPSGDASPAPADDTDPTATRTAARALRWLDRFSATVGGDEILTLPYGDLDVAGALDHDPDAYLAARRYPTPVLRSLGSGTGTALVPTVAPPSGYLPPGTPAALSELDDGSLLLGTDAMIDGQAPSVVLVDGRPVVLASRGAAAGGPGPTERRSTLAVRQRVLSEAVLRLIADDESEPDPLVVVMPAGWPADAAADFFAGLRVPAVELSTLSDNGTRTSVRAEPSELRYPARERDRELGRAIFAASASLRAAGDTLQSLLQRPSEIATSVTGVALSSVSYFDRRTRRRSRSALVATRGWVRDRLGAVTIDAPPGVTLSGTTGSFSATVANDLDEPVVVRVAGRAAQGITVPVSAPLELAPRSRATVQLEVSDVEPGVHNVALRLIGDDGRALPASDLVPIRSAQVSNVIWVILAVGVGLLAVAIALRAGRRLRGRGRPG